MRSKPAALSPKDQLRLTVRALATAEKPFLPVTNPDFAKCSSAINQLTLTRGKPLLLPSALLPALV